MLTLAFILLVIAFIAAIFGFGLMQAPVSGPARIACYFLFFLGIAILLAGMIEQYQQVGLNPAIQSEGE